MDTEKPKDLKTKGKAAMDTEKPKDLKIKGKVKEEQEDLHDEPKKLEMKKSAQQEVKTPTAPPGFQLQQQPTRSPLPKKQSSKRAGKRPADQALDRQMPSSIPDSTLKLFEEIVRVYGNYIDQVIEMGRERFKDENNWRFDSTMCDVLANVCVQKMQRLRVKIDGMKKDLSYSNVCEIVNQLESIHESFHQSPNINAAAMPKCTKQQLISCEDELQHIKKQLLDITSRIRQLKADNKPVAAKSKNLRIGN